LIVLRFAGGFAPASAETVLQDQPVPCRGVAHLAGDLDTGRAFQSCQLAGSRSRHHGQAEAAGQPGTGVVVKQERADAARQGDREPLEPAVGSGPAATCTISVSPSLRPLISPSHRFVNRVRRTRGCPSSTTGSSSQVSKVKEAVAAPVVGMSRLDQYRDPARLSRSAAGCTTAHQIRGGCPAGHGQPPVRN